MGHERVQTLPKTQRWRDIVAEIAAMPERGFDASEIAVQTLRNVETRLQNIIDDLGVNEAFRFLVAISYSARMEDPSQWLREIGIEVADRPTLIDLAKALRQATENSSDSQEYLAFAQTAATDALAMWYKDHNLGQSDLFDATDNSYAVWRDAATGSGFCDLARLYFGKLSERYLKYYLEREASSVLMTLEDRMVFQDHIETYVDSISKHAFETAKITQSFAAGWFNKNARDQFPDDQKIRDFLSFSFKKLLEEFGIERMRS